MEGYSEAELQEYNQCMEILMTGGHVGGLSGCPFCSEIYRRYHKVEEKEEEVCGCCMGQPTNCNNPACSDLGVCIACSVD